MIEISEQAEAKKGVESLFDDKHVSSVLIVGSHGSGKSELSKYANELAAKKFESEKAISIEAYSFCNDYIASIRFSKETQFFERFSGIGFLCLENLDALCKKEATQNALCRVLDSLLVFQMFKSLCLIWSPRDMTEAFS